MNFLYNIYNQFEGELYNLIEDISQKNNLFGKYPEKVAELRTLLEKYRTDDRSVPVKN